MSSKTLKYIKSVSKIHQRLEDIIFRNDFASSFIVSREDALTCLHASLLSKEHIPRFYLKSDMNLIDKEMLWDRVSFCLLTDIKAMSIWTKSNLRCLQISSNMISNLKQEDKAKYINYIEEALNTLLGDGCVFYENGRFTPFCQQDCTIFLPHLSVSNTVLQSNMFKRLKSRNNSKYRYTLKYDNMLHSLNLRNNWDSYHNALKFKLELVWKKNWQNSEIYSEEIDIVQNIVLGEHCEPY